MSIEPPDRAGSVHRYLEAPWRDGAVASWLVEELAASCPFLRPSDSGPMAKQVCRLASRDPIRPGAPESEMATSAYAKAERFPSVPCTDPFAPHCQERGHDHRADEEADQSE